MRGRKPKPVAQQISEGDPRKVGKKKLQEKLEAGPQAARGLPKCPRHLSGRARAAWNYWREELIAMRLDHRPDAMMLEGACVNYARAVSADIAILKDGMEIQEAIYNKHGDEVGYRRKSHPLLTASNQSWKNVRAFCSEFGLSPVSRTRLTIEKDPGEQPDLIKLLSQPRAARGSSAVQ